MKVGVLGGGRMGAGIAHAFLLAGSEVVVVEREQVEDDEARGRLLRQHRHARLGRVDALAERVEVQVRGARPVARPCQHDLAVDHAPGRERLAGGLDDLREVALHRAAVARVDAHVVAVAEDERPEAVPLGLVDPPRPVGGLVGHGGDRPREHGQDRRLQRQRHGGETTPGAARAPLARPTGSGRGHEPHPYRHPTRRVAAGPMDELPSARPSDGPPP